MDSTSVRPRCTHNIKPIEAILLALATLLASGRLVPRLLQRQLPTVSDSFLIASLLNALALFTTDVMTYSWGGMSGNDVDAPEPSAVQRIALKKVASLSLYSNMKLS